MKVLHIYKDYPPVAGGMENHLRRLAEGEARLGLEVTVLVTSRRARTGVARENGVRVIRAGRWATVSSTPLSPCLVSWVRRLDSDVTHLHFPYPWGELAQLAFGSGRVTVVTYQSDIVRQRFLGRLYRPFQRRLLERADAIVATSPPYLQSSPYLKPLAAKCTVIPLGIDPAPFVNAPKARAQAIRAELGTPLVLFVGRLRYYKGVEFLLQALEQVNATLAVVGAGPMEKRLRRQAQRSSAAPRLRFLGHLPDDELPAYYAAADLFALPSCHRSEAFGLVQLEAMAAGTPVVSTELGTGTSFVNLHGETGLVIPPGDPQALASALSQLLADPQRRRLLGEAAQRRVITEFGAERMVARTVELYRELLRRCTRPVSVKASPAPPSTEPEDATVDPKNG